MGLKVRSLESGGILNSVRYFLRSLTGNAGLGSSEIETLRYPGYGYGSDYPYPYSVTWETNHT